MILPQSYPVVLFLMILSLFCLGSWASAFKFAGRWRFEMFYFDFAIGLFVAAMIYAFTVGNLGYDGFSFIDDLQHAGKRQWMYGVMAGLVFNFGNMLLMAAVSVAGLTVAFPMTMGIALLVGTALGFAGRASGNSTMLGLGCVLVLTSVIVNAVMYRMMAVAQHETLARSGHAKSTRRPNALKGIILALVAGILIGSFTGLLDKARLGEQGLGAYALGAVFAFGVFFSSFVFNIFLMNLPVEGEPIDFGSYFNGRLRQHILGWLAGIVWMTGILAMMVSTSVPEQMQPAPMTRYLLAQSAPVLAALWGMLIFRELRNGDFRLKALAMLMLVLFACGLAMVGLAPLYAVKG
ncbi:MAG: putative integral rane protein [Candidatus Solibacter sp.]|nr:putative integral rane protein [Candidatus Solibacter sp.]